MTELIVTKHDATQHSSDEDMSTHSTSTGKRENKNIGNLTKTTSNFYSMFVKFCILEEQPFKIHSSTHGSNLFTNATVTVYFNRYVNLKSTVCLNSWS